MIKNRIIIILSIITVISLWFGFHNKGITETVTTTKIEVIPQTSRLNNTRPVSVKLHTIKVPVINDSIVRDTIYLDKEVKLYSYIDTLENGIIKSSIAADNIYSRSIELETFKEKITTETTNTIVKSMIFLNVGANKYIEGSIRDIQVGVDYTRKDKWRIGVNGGYDFNIKSTFVGVKVGIPLN